MRMSLVHAPTLKETPKEAEVPSHALLLRAGFIRKEAAGIYSFLPLAVRVLKKIEAIVREELDRAGAQEVILPTVQPAELWMESQRWEKYGPELLRFKDRKQAEFCYAPTAEEVMVALVRRDVRSYRQLPVNLYQIANKFRDEIRPRAGLMRGREFVMKDAYSFDADEAGASRTYQAMYDAYVRIFERCGLAFRPVEADTGAIGGSRSHEFQVLADSGEDSIVSCPSCGYTANVEKAEIQRPTGPLGSTPGGKFTSVPTPGKKSIDDVAAFLSLPKDRILKSLYVETDKGAFLVLLRGDRELNEIKLRARTGATWVEFKAGEAKATADARTSDGRPAVSAALAFGYLGPVGFSRKDIRILADDSVRTLADFACGANVEGEHLISVELSDLGITETHDLGMAGHGDPCGRCGGEFAFFRGIEVGHVFFLGTRYSEPMGCRFLDKDGQERPMVMGCYGVGVSRIMAAAIEQNHDGQGIKWPLPLAPFEVAVIPLAADGTIAETADWLYGDLRAAGIDVVIDDRPSRAGEKFADADLIGFPIQVMVGKKGLEQGGVELKVRATGARDLVPLDAAVQRIRELVIAGRRGLRA
ncbi:MAG: proline--tRNA ligase [Myxococcales bacterium]|nr:proline--tRNA ligase [Myxococcales bacterium]